MGLECKADLQELFFRTRAAIAEEKSLAIETVKLIGALNKADAAVGLDMSEAAFIKALGLSPDQYYKVAELAPGQEVVQESAPGRKPIPAVLRHQVFRRDQGQCTYKFASGERYCEKHMLELDHILPVARGGENSLENLRLLCRKHNQAEAKKVFGGKFMEAPRLGA